MTTLTAHDSVLSLQGAAGNGAVTQVLASGHPLGDQTRRSMESLFGIDLGDVRVHTSDDAAHSAGSMGANAYTVGRDIVFAADRYQPYTSEGRRLLAHELAHVIQQSSPAGRHITRTATEAEAADAGTAVGDGQAVGITGAAPVGMQCEIVPAADAQRRHAELAAWLNTYEGWAREHGQDPTTSHEYMEKYNEFQALNRQLNEQVSRTTPRLFYGTIPKTDKLDVPEVGTVSLAPSPPAAPPVKKAPRKARGLTKDLVIELGGQKITIAKASVQGEDLRIVRMLDFEFNAVEAEALASLDDRQAFFEDQGRVGSASAALSSLNADDAKFWQQVFQNAKRGRDAVRNGDLDQAGEYLQQASRALAKAKSVWHTYRLRHIGGLENVKEGLTDVRDLSFKTLQILAALETGGQYAVVAQWIAAGAPIASELIDAAAGAQDWSKFATDTLVTVLTTAVLQKFRAAGGKDLPIDEAAIRRIVHGVVIGMGSRAIGTVVEAVRQSVARGQHVNMTETAKAAVMAALDPKAGLWDALLAALSANAQFSRKGQGPSEPAGTSGAKPAGAPDEPTSTPTAGAVSRGAPRRSSKLERTARAFVARTTIGLHEATDLGRVGTATGSGGARPVAAQVTGGTAAETVTPSAAEPLTRTAPAPGRSASPATAPRPQAATAAGAAAPSSTATSGRPTGGWVSGYTAPSSGRTTTPQGAATESAGLASSPGAAAAEPAPGTPAVSPGPAGATATPSASRWSRPVRGPQDLIRESGGRLISTNGGLEELYNRAGHPTLGTQRRAASSELKAVLQYLDQGAPDGRTVLTLEIVGSRSRGRSPDCVIRYTDGSVERVEITTLTSAPRGHSPGGAALARATAQRGATPSDIAAAIVRKAADAPARRSQLTAPMPNVRAGGTIRVNLTHTSVSPAAVDQAVQSVAGTLGAHVERIEVGYMDRASASEPLRTHIIVYVRVVGGFQRLP